MILCCFEAFWEKLTENFSFVKKMTILDRNRNTQNGYFSQQLWKEANQEVNMDLFKQLIWFNKWKGKNIIKKKVFLLKVSQIELNFAFVMYWSIYGKIHWNLLFLVKKVIITEKNTEILRKLVFLNKFEKRQIQRKIWICLSNYFLSNQ